MKRIGRILALLFCLSLSACSLMPEEEVYRSAPVTKDYEAAPYQFAAVVRGDMELTEKISLNYVPVQTRATGRSSCWSCPSDSWRSGAR